MNNYKLHMLINVFDISPAFLLPIYNKDDEYYFQCLMDHRISDFTIASMEKFEECKQYTVDENIYKTTGDSALYAIEIADGTHYVYTEDVMHQYLNYIKLFTPKWIFAQPSFVYHLGQYINKSEPQIANMIQYVELVGELLTPEIKNEICNFFPNADVVNMYGMQEKFKKKKKLNL